MIEKIPNLHQFLRLYWNEMGIPAYGDIQNAFNQFLQDCRRLHDNGESILREVYKELMLISGNPEYEKWLRDNRGNPIVSSMTGGRLLQPNEIEKLLSMIKNSWWELDS